MFLSQISQVSGIVRLFFPFDSKAGVCTIYNGWCVVWSKGIRYFQKSKVNKSVIQSYKWVHKLWLFQNFIQDKCISMCVSCLIEACVTFGVLTWCWWWKKKKGMTFLAVVAHLGRKVQSRSVGIQEKWIWHEKFRRENVPWGLIHQEMAALILMPSTQAWRQISWEKKWSLMLWKLHKKKVVHGELLACAKRDFFFSVLAIIYWKLVSNKDIIVKRVLNTC